MSNSKKICLVGGEDAHKRIALSKYLLKNNFKVTILGSKSYNYSSDIEFIEYSLNRKLNPISDFKTIIQYRKIFIAHKFDIIQTFDTKPAFLVPLATCGLNTKLVRTITGLGTLFMSNKLKYKLLRQFYNLLHCIVRDKVDCTTFQNNDDLGYFLDKKLARPSNSTLIFGSGIEIKKNQPIAKRQNTIFTYICVARLVYEKGIVNYLEAAKICIDKGFEFKFWLVGPLEEHTKRLNLDILKDYSKIVDWLGERNDIDQLMLDSDAFVLPTFREGLSRVILEACTIGLPIITTYVPGTKEIVREGEEGLFAKVNNSEDLAEVMIKLATDKALCDRLSKNSAIRAHEFSLKTISNQYINLYRKIL